MNPGSCPVDVIFRESRRTYSAHRYNYRYSFQVIAAAGFIFPYVGLRDFLGREAITTIIPSEQQGHGCFSTGFSAISTAIPAGIVTA